MKTPTHVAINYLLFSRLGMNKKYSKFFLLGGAMPDVPICLAFAAIFLWSEDLTNTVAVFRGLYESNVVMIGLHNVFHSPLSLFMLLLFSFLAGRYKKQLDMFIAGCFVHSFIDIYTHVDDGPLMFWPFDLESRFTSRISHWDPSYGGDFVLMAEVCILICAVSLVYYRQYLKPAWGMFRKAKKFI